ncbi:MAG: hypothetical protein FWF92_05980 [Oscillospiraceae bacterium]|nr:hypothetical protein [Oscillospiraceae bacterium]
MKIFKCIFLIIIVIGIALYSENNLIVCHCDSIVKYNEIIKAYQVVLQDMDVIKKIYKENNYYTKPFAYNDDDYDCFKVNFFTVIDMDGDNIPEVVLETSMIGDIIVLYYYDGIIYGYTCPYRGMLRLKKDGTFEFSSGAADNGKGQLEFSSGKCKKIEIWREIWNNDYDFNSHTNIYTCEWYIYGQKVSEEEFDLFVNEQYEKEDVEWHEFNEDTISEDFVIVWDNLN